MKHPGMKKENTGGYGWLLQVQSRFSTSVDKEVADLGQWLLEELRELIHSLATGGGDKDESDSNPARQNPCLPIGYGNRA